MLITMATTKKSLYCNFFVRSQSNLLHGFEKGNLITFGHQGLLIMTMPNTPLRHSAYENLRLVLAFTISTNRTICPFKPRNIHFWLDWKVIKVFPHFHLKVPLNKLLTRGIFERHCLISVIHSSITLIGWFCPDYILSHHREVTHISHHCEVIHIL